MSISSTDPDEFEVIRDPLWNTIRLDRDAVRIIDTPAFQRLRHIRQLGLAYLVYPGATHTRFDHALGVFHLARRALGLLQERGELTGVDPLECRVVPYAALLHDIGHYPFSHALEELDAGHVPEHHEALTARFLQEGALREVLDGIAPGAAGKVERLIRGASDSPLQGLVSGSLDLDKIEYLSRDATFCGVPYGAVDVDRLLHAITLVTDPVTGKREIGVHAKGLSALESLLFAKYQMFRNVYWHHAVRSATALYKRLVQDAVDAGAIQPAELIGRSDEGLLGLIEGRCRALDNEGAERVLHRWLPDLRERRLPKRALEIPGEELRHGGLESWFYSDAALVGRLENAIAAELELPRGGVFLDYPEKPRMLELDILVRYREGAGRLTQGGRAGLIDLPRIADELYHSARVMRIFTTERRAIEVGAISPLLALPAGSLRSRLDEGGRLL